MFPLEVTRCMIVIQITNWCDWLSPLTLDTTLEVIPTHGFKYDFKSCRLFLIY